MLEATNTMHVYAQVHSNIYIICILVMIHGQVFVNATLEFWPSSCVNGFTTANVVVVVVDHLEHQKLEASPSDMP